MHTGNLSIEIVIIGNKNGTRGYLFVSLPSDDVSYGSTPSPRIPYRVLGSAHCDHVHTAPLPLLSRRADPRAHKHTYTLVVSALPIHIADSGGSGRKGGEVGQRPCSSPALLCNLHLRAFDNLEQSVQNLLQIMDRLLLGHVQSLM